MNTVIAEKMAQVLAIEPRVEGTHKERIALSSHSKDAGVLAYLAMSEKWVIRRNVAANINSSVKTLAYLALDARPEVQRSVAINRNTPEHVLDMLSRSSDVDIRKSVAYNPSAAPSTLLALSEDKEWKVIRAVALNPNTPEIVLRWYGSDPRVSLIQATAMNPMCPVDLLTSFVSHSSVAIRRAALTNRNCPIEFVHIVSSLPWEQMDWNRPADLVIPATIEELLYASSASVEALTALATNTHTSEETLLILLTLNIKVVTLSLASRDSISSPVFQELLRSMNASVFDTLMARPAIRQELSLIVANGDVEEAKNYEALPLNWLARSCGATA